MARFTLYDLPAWLRLVPTEPMLLSYPEVLEQQPSDRGNNLHFSNTLKQEFPTWSACTPRDTFVYLKGYI